jgi:hypothetical protein
MDEGVVCIEMEVADRARVRSGSHHCSMVRKEKSTDSEFAGP